MNGPVVISATTTGTKIAEGTDGVYAVRRAVIQIKSSNWAGNSLLLKQIATGADKVAPNPLAVPGDLKNVPYTDRTTGSPVSAGTAISADALVEVDLNGVDLYVVPTIGGVAVICYVNPMVG